MGLVLAETTKAMAKTSPSPAARSQLPVAVMERASVEATMAMAMISPSPAEGHSYRRQWRRGIGGGSYKDGNDINIAGGKVTATGGDYGAGIGGGNQWQWQNITITGGEVTAAGGGNGAGIGGGLRKEGEKKITVSGDATLKVQGGLTDEWDGAGAGIGNGGRHNGDTGSFIPVNGAETEPDTSNLTTGKIEYYAPGADMTKDEPTSTTFGSLVQPGAVISR